MTPEQEIFSLKVADFLYCFLYMGGYINRHADKKTAEYEHRFYSHRTTIDADPNEVAGVLFEEMTAMLEETKREIIPSGGMVLMARGSMHGDDMRFSFNLLLGDKAT